MISFLIKKFFNLENFGANFSSIKSLKKRLASKYKSEAPIEVEVKTSSIPHHLPNTKPENINNGIAKPKNKVHTTEKAKNIIVRNKKFSFLYFKITSLLTL